MNLSTANLVRWGKLLSTYVAGQGAMQAIQLVTGFLLINCLSKQDYATFTIVIAIQSTTGILVELGFSSCLQGLIGRRYRDHEVVGRYMAACRYYRDRLLVAGSIGLFAVFYLFAPKYGWDYGLWLILWLTVVTALFFQAQGAVYGPAFTLNERLKEMYVISVSASVFRLAMITGVYLLGWLTGPTALVFGALQVCIGGLGAREFAKGYMVPPPPDADLSEEKKEIRSQALPRMPSNVFYAFEGQISVFILGLIGATSSVAEIGALGRLGMLFILFRRASGVLVNPYFAKLDVRDVPQRGFLLIAACFGFSALVSVFTYFFPGVPLFVLGDGYQHLDYEVFLMLMASSLGVVTITTFSICVARKYIFPWFAAVDLVPSTVVMIGGFFVWDLSQLTNALYYMLAITLAKLCSILFIFVYGIGRDRKQLRSDDD